MDIRSTVTVAEDATLDPAVMVAAAAANLAAWHDLHVRALGYATEWPDGLWLTPDPVPAIFFHAIAIRPGASAGVIGQRVARHRWASVSDPWADLAMPAQGYSLDGDHAWMVRPPGEPPPGEPPPGVGGSLEWPDLLIEQVSEADGLADFERAAAIGFGSPPRPAFSWHAPPLLADPRLRVWRGRVAGETIAVAMGFAAAGVLGIYGVATLPGARRRGYGTAITRRAIEAAPDLPVVLQPSAAAERMYGRLGFRRFATFRAWERYPGPVEREQDA